MRSKLDAQLDAHRPGLTRQNQAVPQVFGFQEVARRHVDLAREGLENLSTGPVFIAGDNAAAVHRASGPDRAVIVLGAHRTVQAILGRKGDRA